MARRIQNIYTVIVIVKLKHRRCNGDSSLLLNLHPVGHGMSCRRLPLTLPAKLIAPPYKRNFSVKVVFPASGCEIMAKVLRLLISSAILLNSISSVPFLNVRFSSENPKDCVRQKRARCSLEYHIFSKKANPNNSYQSTSSGKWYTYNPYKLINV